VWADITLIGGAYFLGAAPQKDVLSLRRLLYDRPTTAWRP
jgi:hypothetical protein